MLGVLVLLSLSLVSRTTQRPAGRNDRPQVRYFSNDIPAPFAVPARHSILPHEPLLTSEKTTQASKPGWKRRKEPPPPSEAEVQHMSTPDFVRKKKYGFGLKGSEPWIEAFGKHPALRWIERDSPTSEEYARRYDALYDADTDISTGLRLSQALRGYFMLNTDRFDKKYMSDVLMHLREIRRLRINGISQSLTRQNRRSRVEGPLYHRAPHPGAKTQDEKALEAERFAGFLEKSGIAYDGMTSEQLERETRYFAAKYYGGNVKRASTEMYRYLIFIGKDKADAKMAKLCRTDYNRLHYIAQHQEAARLQRKKRKDELASQALLKHAPQGEDVDPIDTSAPDSPVYHPQLGLLQRRVTSSSPINVNTHPRGAEVGTSSTSQGRAAASAHPPLYAALASYPSSASLQEQPDAVHGKLYQRVQRGKHIPIESTPRPITNIRSSSPFDHFTNTPPYIPSHLPYSGYQPRLSAVPLSTLDGSIKGQNAKELADWIEFYNRLHMDH
ncbi:hypothetical protein CBS101457_003119 [Exobasidium rhododendri]|nr:hypothetical protein CBS101457_003119 [Exobasidium rhododendri]